MGIIRLTLITAALILLAMFYYGRDDGLPADRLGRAPAPEPAETLAEEGTPQMTPVAAEEAVAEEAADQPGTSAPPGTTAIEATPAPAASPAPTTGELEPAVSEETAPAPEPIAAPEPAIVAQPAPEPTPEAQPEPATAQAPAPDTAPDTLFDTVLYVSGGRVNVRSGPSTDFAVLTALTRGTEVVDLGDVGAGWHQILVPSGETGYMSGDFLSPDPQ